MTESTIYWLTRLDAIRNAISICGTFTAVLFVVGVIACAVAFITRETTTYEAEEEKACNLFNKSIKPTIWLCVLSMLLMFANAFIPSTRDMIAIKVIPVVANEENVDKISSISKDFLDVTAKWLDDMKMNKSEKINK